MKQLFYFEKTQNFFLYFLWSDSPPRTMTWITTRWNSHYNMLHVMLRLKVPLIYLRDTEGDDWKKTVPMK